MNSWWNKLKIEKGTNKYIKTQTSNYFYPVTYTQQYIVKIDHTRSLGTVAASTSLASLC